MARRSAVRQLLRPKHRLDIEADFFEKAFLSGEPDQAGAEGFGADTDGEFDALLGGDKSRREKY